MRDHTRPERPQIINRLAPTSRHSRQQTIDFVGDRVGAKEEMPDE